ncbi:MAG: hypothetical protein Q7K42_05250, partial [Candidatus Diapherotrites archaeon]|nr:hypothetical protein [Candidatus Diapherotrites archaeon]
TYFQFIGPIAGAFLGAGFGFLAVLGANLGNLLFTIVSNFLSSGKAINAFTIFQAISLVDVLRLLPMAFAAIYFAKSKTENKKDISTVVPILCMLIFLANPIGFQAWYYSLFWLIPVIVKFFFSKNLFARSLGATFTAHAIGGAIWAWTVPMTVQAWTLLMPITLFERLLFAAGISISFILFNTLLNKLETILPENSIQVEQNYTLSNFLKNLTKLFAVKN